MDTPRRALIAATLLMTILVVLVCLIPKPANDLFFELRIGSDILHTGRLPHTDTYSWTEHGRRWDVPEWLSFVLYALAYRVGGFFGVWALMVLLTLAAVGVAWAWLVRRLSLPWAFGITNLMLLAMSPTLQERPYAFTYPLLAVGLVILSRARAENRPRLLGWLPLLCTVWTNLHQGVVVLVCLLFAYALGDALTAAWVHWETARETLPDLLTPAGQAQALIMDRERAEARLHARSAGRMLAAAAACGFAVMASPYGWRVYWNVFITLRDHTLMSNVTEWNSVAVLPLGQMQPFLLLTALTIGALALSRRRSFAEVLALMGLFAESLLHARNIALFAVGVMVIGGPHFAPALELPRRHLRLPPRVAGRSPWLVALALVSTALVALGSIVSLRRAIGPRGYSLEGIGEAVACVPRFPSQACAFIEAENFPPHLRLLNNFEIGGYVMWRLPHQPVFVDGRLDVYTGKTFDDMVTLAREPGSLAGLALQKQYDFDAVLTTSARQARAFAADTHWQLVYADPPGPPHQHAHIFLRRRPQLAALIARCLRH